MNAAPDIFTIVFSAESDMRRVYDHALLLHDRLARAESINADDQGALIWPAADLLMVGLNLRKHCDAMYDAATKLRQDSKPAPAEAAPIVDPSKLSVDQMFALFDALGTVGEVMDGLLCQPKFQSKTDLNKAGEMLEQLREVIAEARNSIRTEVASRPPSKDDADRLVFFAAEEWVDGGCEPEAALKGLTTALTDLRKAVQK
jgi:hypothetical protein